METDPISHKQLDNGLNFGVVKGIRGGIGIDTHGINSTLVSTIESRSRVSRVSDKAVNGMRHLMTEDRELIHLQQRLVFSVDGLVGEKTGSGDLDTVSKSVSPCPPGSRAAYHIGGHAVANKEDDILGLLLRL